jgi:type VI secretion system FHA domain protein
MSLVLKVVSGAGDIGRSEIEVEARCSLGRGDGNDVVLRHKAISRQHAVIERIDGIYYVCDTSANGTYLNSTEWPIGCDRRERLSPGDRISMGDYEFAVEERQPGAPGPAPEPFDTSRGEDAEWGNRTLHARLADPGPFGGDPLAPEPGQDPDPMAGFSGPGDSQDVLDALERRMPQPRPEDLALEGGPSLEGGDRTLFGGPGSAARPDPGGDPFHDPFGAEAVATPGPTVPHGRRPAGAEQDPFANTAPSDASAADWSAPRDRSGAVPPPEPRAGVPASAESWPEPSADSRHAPEPRAPESAPPDGLGAPWDSGSPDVLDATMVDTNAPIGFGAQGARVGAAPDPSGRAPGPAPGADPAPAAGDSAAIETLLRAAGIDAVSARELATPQLAQALGQALTVMVTGLMGLAEARNKVRRELGAAEHTIMGVRGNNPLKFSRSPRDALHSALAPGPADLGLVDALAECLDDLQNHQMATVAGMEAGYEDLMRRFDPAELERRFGADGQRRLLPQGRGRHWERYVAEYRRLKEDRGFRDLFGRAFAARYDEEVEVLERRDAVPRRRGR